MNPAVSKLTKFLRLEAERGFDDHAVVGGLARMLEPWREEAQQSAVPPELISVVVSRLQDYARLAPNSRREALQGLWTRLQAVFPEMKDQELLAKTRPAPQSPPEPSPPGTSAAEGAPHAKAEAEATPGPDRPQAPSEAALRPKGGKAEPPPEPARDAPSPEAEPQEAISLNAPLTSVSGIGPKSANTLRKLGLQTLGDLLWHLPRRYDDYSKLETINHLWYGQEVTIIATIESATMRAVRRGSMKLTEAVVSDGTGSLTVTWFNQPWIAKRLKPGKAIVLSGRVDQYLGRLTMNNPEWEPLERQQLHTNRIVPVYPLTAGVSGKWLRKVIHSVVTRLAPSIEDPLPEGIRRSAGLMPLGEALQQIHFPDSQEALERARHRLAFDEMFMLQLGVLRQKRAWEQIEGEPLAVDDGWMERFTAGLPYALTSAQQKALSDIRADLATEKPMNRLLQGDVGSGKTVVAAAAIGIAVAGGAQAAFMAPTSILAEQHYRTLLDLLPSAVVIDPGSIRLLIGATPEAEKAEIRSGLQDGSIHVVIGTHALLEGPVEFKRLGLVIIDEQHRFGVAQRAALRAKGSNPNLLVMTATPIPRSLALTIFGDLDLTIIDEFPPGRTPIETRVLWPGERTRAHQFIRGQIEKGGQAFIIYPLVEGSEKVQAKAAVDEQKMLQKEVFPQYRIGLLHGRMKAEDKDEVMAKFRSGEYDILVSTSVVEVGVDIPNACVMLIEGADRFGLAQLHQFRGRVGRGERPSYCLLIPDQAQEKDNERLKAMESTNDGFKLAEMDLQQRGPGDFFGTRQSGLPELHTAELTDVRLIEKARREASRLYAEDPDLSRPEHARLAQELERFWSSEKGEIS